MGYLYKWLSIHHSYSLVPIGLVVSERRYFKAGQSETGSASTGNVFHYIKTKCCTFVESLSYMIATMIGYDHQNGFIKDYKYVKW